MANFMDAYINDDPDAASVWDVVSKFWEYVVRLEHDVTRLFLLLVISKLPPHVLSRVVNTNLLPVLREMGNFPHYGNF